MKLRPTQTQLQKSIDQIRKNGQSPDVEFTPVFEREFKVADRTRTRMLQYDEYPTNLTAYTMAYNSIFIDSSRTVDIPETAIKKRQQIVDSPKWPKSPEQVDNDCTNWKRTIREDGFVLPDGNENHLYTTLYNNELLTQEWYPTLGLLPYVAAALPEVFRDPRLASYLEAKGVTQWHQAQDGWKGPKVSLYQGFDLPTFIKELPEALGVCRSYLTKGGLAERWSALMSRNRSLPERLRAAANERLAYKWGTEQLLRDCKTLHRILTSWKSRADKLFADQNTIRKCRRQPDGNIPRGESEVYGSTVVFPLFGASNARLEVETSYEWGCNQTLAYKYSVRSLKTGLSRLFQLMDSLGVRPDAGIVWDNIPYSFIIDWFFDVGSWLHANASGDWIQAEIKLLSMCNSAHVKRIDVVRLSQNLNSPGEYPNWLSVPIFTVETEYYWRKKAELPVFKRESIELSSEPWSISRVLNATALGTQLVLKRRNVSAKIRQLKELLDTKGWAAAGRDVRKAIRKVEDFVIRQPLRDSKKELHLQRAVERSLKKIEAHAAMVIRDRKRAKLLNSRVKGRSQQTVKTVKVGFGNKPFYK